MDEDKIEEMEEEDEDGEEEDSDNEDEEEEEDSEDEEEEEEPMEEEENIGKDEEEIKILEGSEESDGESEKCAVCLNKFIGQDIGIPENCSHTFCLDCILEWSKKVNTCPVDRKEFDFIYHKEEPEGKVLERIPVEKPEESEDESNLDQSVCEICRSGDREDSLLLCDACDRGFHCDCLDPPLETIPIEEWFCPECRTENEDDEAAEGSTSGVSRAARGGHHRAIARTLTSETVRSRIQRRRTQRSTSQRDSSPTTPRRRVVRRKRKVRRKTKRKTQKRRTKSSSGTTKTKGKTKTRKRKTKRKTVKRKSRKVKRKKTVTRRSRATAQPLAIPTVKIRIAKKLGMEKPPPGHTLPVIKKQAPPRSLNARRADIGINELLLFGNKDELLFFDNGTLNEDRSTSGHSSQSSRLELPSTSSASSDVDILSSILQEQTVLHTSSKEVTIHQNGYLSLRPSSKINSSTHAKPSESHSNKSNSTLLNDTKSSETGISSTSLSKNDQKPSNKRNFASLADTMCSETPCISKNDQKFKHLNNSSLLDDTKCSETITNYSSLTNGNHRLQSQNTNLKCSNYSAPKNINYSCSGFANKNTIGENAVEPLKPCAFDKPAKKGISFSFHHSLQDKFNIDITKETPSKDHKKMVTFGETSTHSISQSEMKMYLWNDNYNADKKILPLNGLKSTGVLSKIDLHCAERSKFSDKYSPDANLNKGIKRKCHDHESLDSRKQKVFKSNHKSFSQTKTDETSQKCKKVSSKSHPSASMEKEILSSGKIESKKTSVKSRPHVSEKYSESSETKSLASYSQLRTMWTMVNGDKMRTYGCDKQNHEAFNKSDLLSVPYSETNVSDTYSFNSQSQYFNMPQLQVSPKDVHKLPTSNDKCSSVVNAFGFYTERRELKTEKSFELDSVSSTERNSEIESLSLVERNSELESLSGIKRIDSSSHNDLKTEKKSNIKQSINSSTELEKKLKFQEEVVAELKGALKPFYQKGIINKEEYKEILRKCVPKVCQSKSADVCPERIKNLVAAYVKKIQYEKKAKHLGKNQEVNTSIPVT